MNPVVAQKLREFVTRYGWESLSKDERRIEDLLSDACPECRAEVNVIMSALREQVVADLLSAGRTEPLAVRQKRLVGRLVRNLALAETAANWAVESWVSALGMAPAPTSTTTASSERQLALLPVKQDGKWGYVRTNGTLAVSQQFDEAWGFSEGLAPVKMGDKWGYIDETGRFVINPQFDCADLFAFGLAAVQVGKKWGYADKTGKLVISPQFDGILGSAASLDVHVVSLGDKWGFVYLPDGRALSPQFDQILEYDDTGPLQLAVRVGDKWGFVDKTGGFIVRPQFDAVPGSDWPGFSSQTFSLPLAVKMGDKWGYVDGTGRFVISPQFDSAETFSEGLALVSVERRYSYIDETGMVAFHFQGPSSRQNRPRLTGKNAIEIFLEETKSCAPSSFSCGLASAPARGPKGSKTGYIDKSGRFVIDPQFDYAGPFSDGLAEVWIGEKKGYIGATGRFVIPPQYDQVVQAGDDRFCVRIGGAWGCVDRTGRVVVQPRFDRSFFFSEGTARVTLGNKLGYIDRAGREIWPLTE